VSETLRNLVRRKTRTGLTVFGIAIGVFALTVMGAMSEFFDITLAGAERLISRTVEVGPASSSPDDRPTTTTVQQLRRVDGVAYVFDYFEAPLPERPGDLSLGPPHTVVGLEPRYVPDFYPDVRLRAGRWLEEGDDRAVVVGAKVAAKQGLGVGGTLTWRKNDYTIVGVVAGTNTFPDTFVLMPRATFRRDMKLPGSAIGTLQVLPLPGVDLDGLAVRIGQEVPRVRARPPRQALADIRQGLAMFSALTLGGALMAALVGGLAVANTMIMSVNERTREIGIKKAVGAENGTIVREYLAESAAIGLVGGIVGLWLGWAVAALLNATVATAVGGEVWQVTPRLALVALVFAVALGSLAGLYPAWHAARLQPVQALRAE
jgi:putative ABC transport system permease protein